MNIKPIHLKSTHLHEKKYIYSASAIYENFKYINLILNLGLIYHSKQSICKDFEYRNVN